MMRLTAPEWLLLLPLLAAAGWFWPGLGLRRPLRALLLLMAVVLAAGPEWRRFGDGLDLWVLVDHSDSARELLAPQQAEWETLLRRSQGSADRLRFVDFAGETVTRGARLRSGAEGVQYAGPTDSTRLRSALLHVLAEVDENRSSRLLVWTDGQSTEPLEGMAERLGRQEVPLDYRRAVRAGARDWRITDLILPQRVQPGQAFLLEAWVAGDEDGPVEVQVLQGGVEVARRPVEVVNGMGRLRLSARLTKPGAVEFQARVQQEGDALVGNNSAARWVEVTSGPRVVLITGYTNDPVASVLAAQGFEVETLADASRAQAGVLAGAKVVILNNVAASEMSVPFLKALDFYVNEQGGGLVMVGGQNSFGSGGYFGSALEPLLPVSMELKQEHRKLALALAIVMDRSGSMAATVAGSGATKMQLANEGAGRAVMLLGDSDYLTVLAVDSTPHVVAAPVQVGPNRDMLEDAVRRVQSAGGGIFVYSGLRGAWDELKRVPVGQRHIILFSDAADSEEPGDYKNLIAEMVKEKTTVSVIGMGSSTDSDAAFLEDIAQRGKGRIFFSDNPLDIPALFAQETVAVARSTFVEEAAPIAGTPGWLEMAAGAMEWPAKVDGYNLTYLKPGAVQALVTKDEYAAPLLAFWRRGSGRVVAVTMPLGGRYSDTVRQWQGYGGFMRSLTRWTMGESLPPGLGLRTELQGSWLMADLYYDESWTEQVMRQAPILKLAHGRTARVSEVPWERLEPGRYRARVDLENQDMVRGAVRLGDAALPFGPLSVMANPEWDQDPQRLQELAEVSRLSGGVERLDLSEVWQAPRPPAWRSLLPILLPILLVLLLLEAWQTRAGWQLFRARTAPQAA